MPGIRHNPILGGSNNPIFAVSRDAFNAAHFGSSELEVIRGEDYGMVGDDSTICDTALTNAMADLPAAGGTIRVGPGTFKITSSFDFGLRKSLICAGPGLTEFHYTGSSYAFNIGVPGQVGAPDVCVNKLAGFRVRGTGVIGGAAGAAGSIGIRIIKCQFPLVERVDLRQIEMGMKIDASDLWVADGVVTALTMFEVKYGLLLTGNTSKQINQMTFVGGYFAGRSDTGSYGVKFDTNTLHGSNRFLGTNVEGFNGTGSIGFWVSWTASPGYNLFLNTGQEGCTTDFQLDANATGNLVLGNAGRGVVDNGISNIINDSSYGQRDSIRYIPYAASITPDAVNGMTHEVDLLTGAITINNPTNPFKGQHLRFFFQQDGTGGRVITWGSKYVLGANWTPSTAPSARNSIEFVYDNNFDKWVQIGGMGGLGYGIGVGGAVTQITSSATAVTLNKVTGQVTTVALTTAAGAEERFTVNNTTVAATDCVTFGTTYNGAGTPAVSVLNVAANAFDIVVTNLHATNALNAAMVINFAVIKAVAS